VAVEVEEAEVRVAVAEEVVEAVRVPVEDSRHRRLPHVRPLLDRQLPPRPLVQAPRARELVHALQAVQQPLPGQPAARPLARSRKAALARAAAHPGKVLLPRGRLELVETWRRAVLRLAR